MTDILLKDIFLKMDTLDTSVSNIQITVGSVQDKVSQLSDDVRVIQKFNDKVETMIGNTIMSANNAVDSMETAVTIGGILIAFGAIALQHLIRKKTQNDVIRLIDEHLSKSKEFTNHIDTYFRSEKFKELLQEKIKISENTSTSQSDTSDGLDEK